MLLLFLDQLCITYTFTYYMTCGTQYENVWSPARVPELQGPRAPGSQDSRTPPPSHISWNLQVATAQWGEGGYVRPPEGESQKTTSSVGTSPWVVVCNDNVLEQHQARPPQRVDWSVQRSPGARLHTEPQHQPSTQLQQLVNDTLAVPEEARLDSNLRGKFGLRAADE